MKIAAVGDIHLATGRFTQISRVVQADLLIINGDLTNFGGRDAAPTVIGEARRAAARAVAQFGNLDQPKVNDYLEEAGMDMLGRIPVYNPGMLADGGWLEIDIINSELSTTFHDPRERYHRHRRRPQRPGNRP